MQGYRALTKAVGAALLVLSGCPDTTSKFGGSSAGDDEIGEPPVDGDVVDDHRTYFIGETTKFDGGGECENATLNTVTNTLRNWLDDRGWSGLRFVNDETWPEDFREGSFSTWSLDEIHADAARVTVYAGHGSTGRLQWGKPSPQGECLTDIDDQVRLGTLAGDKAAATLLLTSCTMRVDQMWTSLKHNASRQFFGYHNSPHIGYDEARKVFERSRDGQASAAAWLEEMVHNVHGGNSPVVLTLGIDPDDALEAHGVTNLANGEGFLQNAGEPIDGYFFEWFDNGCSTVCGNCRAESQAVPEMAMGTTVPRLKLIRPRRSAAELTDLAVELLAGFDIGALDEREQARLEAWAGEIVASGDVGHARIIEEPAIDVTYDPTSDRLRITDRSALERARPRPDEIVEDSPELELALRGEAESVLARLPARLSDPVAGEFEVSTREVGFGDATGSSPSITYEVLFTRHGRMDQFVIDGHGVGIGVTRHGEPSTILVSAIDVETVGPGRIVQTPEQALERLRTQLEAEYPNAVEIEFIEPRIGYALAEAEDAVEVVPSLLVAYALAFGSGEARVASRSFPVRISLVATDSPIESLLADDPDSEPGARRDSH